MHVFAGLLLLVALSTIVACDPQGSSTADGVTSGFVLDEMWRTGGADVPDGPQFSGPFLALALSPDGDAYVLDQSVATVSILDSETGDVVGAFGGPGKGPGELAAPAAMAFDAEDRLWVAASFIGRYSVFDRDGAFLHTATRPGHATARRVFPLHVSGDGTVLDHEFEERRLRVFQVDATGEIQGATEVEWPPFDARGGGPLIPGSARSAVAALQPVLRWTYARDGESVWLARSDSLNLVRISLAGDTLAAAAHSHRLAEFTDEELEAIDRANHEAGREVDYAPILIRSLHALDDGRVLVLLRSDADDRSELDVFSPRGAFLGTLHTPFVVHPRSEFASRGDTLLLPVVGDLDVPEIVKAVLRPGG